MAVAAVTAGYTAWGGLPASLRTDQVQAVMIMVLVSVALGAMFLHVEDPLARARDGGWRSSRLRGARGQTQGRNRAADRLQQRWRGFGNRVNRFNLLFTRLDRKQSRPIDLERQVVSRCMTLRLADRRRRP